MSWALTNIRAITKRELRGYFSSPVAYVFIVIFLLLTGFFTFMQGKIASWWMPDEIVFVDEIPHTATGKIQKTVLRERFKNFVLPAAATMP